MSKPFTLDLLFLWDKGDVLANLDAFSYVTLGDVIFRTNYKGVEGKIVLTNRCVTLGEFEQEIDRLHRELDQVRDTARDRFAELSEFRKSA